MIWTLLAIFLALTSPLKASASVSHSSQSDWQAQTLTNLDALISPGDLSLAEDNSNTAFLESWPGAVLDTAKWDNYQVGTGSGLLTISGSTCSLQKAAATAGFWEQNYLVTDSPVTGVTVGKLVTGYISVDAAVTQTHQGTMFLVGTHVANAWFQNTEDHLKVECQVDSSGETWTVAKRVSGIPTTLASSTSLNVTAATIKMIFAASNVTVLVGGVQLYSGPHGLPFTDAYIYLSFQTTDTTAHQAGFGEVRVYSPQYQTSGSIAGSMDLGSVSGQVGILSWDADLPTGTSLKFRTRSSASGTGNWSAWSSFVSNASGSNIMSPAQRYLEYEGSFETSNPLVSPQLHDLSVNYKPAEGLDSSRVYGYPNPFNPDKSPIRMAFTLDQAQEVHIKIFDLLGRPLWSLDKSQGQTIPGENTFTWNGRDDQNREQPNGVYLIQIEAGGRKEIKKIAILR